MTMHHEYMHAYFFAHNFKMSDSKEHGIIHNWHADQAAAWGDNLSIRAAYYSSGYCGSSATYLKYGFKIINYIP